MLYNNPISSGVDYYVNNLKLGKAAKIDVESAVS